jgi:uncharacterized membrane protein
MLTSTGDYPASTVRGLEVNTLWDGLFHAIAFIFVAVGIVILWIRGDGAWHVGLGRAFFGWILVGWGLFNLVEGIVNHHILGLHHVRSGPNEIAYDIAFLTLGLTLMLGGWRLGRSVNYSATD